MERRLRPIRPLERQMEQERRDNVTENTDPENRAKVSVACDECRRKKTRVRNNNLYSSRLLLSN